jgi:hypothetical protein
MLNSSFSFSDAGCPAAPPLIASPLPGAELGVRSQHLRRLMLSQASCGSCTVGLGVVRDSEHQIMGVVEGLIVDPRQRILHAIIIRSTDPADESCHLLPLTSVCATFDARTRCLEVEMSGADLGCCAEGPIDPDDVPPFSDDDWLKCLFRRAQ